MSVSRIDTETKGAWIIHHGRKLLLDTHGSADFPAIDVAAKAATLLTKLGQAQQVTISMSEVRAIAQASGLNPNYELDGLFNSLTQKRLIDISKSEVTVLGVTTRAALGHAVELYDDFDPKVIEHASLDLAEIASQAPVSRSEVAEQIGDEHRLKDSDVNDFLDRAEQIGFVDKEGHDSDSLLFNGNLFRRDSVAKSKRVLTSLKESEQRCVIEVATRLQEDGCLTHTEVERILTAPVLEKLVAAGIYDYNTVENETGSHVYVTAPSAFHKFVSPFVDDCFDMARLLVAALKYGMTLRSSSLGRINMLPALLSKLVSGQRVGPATAIGRDYRALEINRVVQLDRSNQHPGRFFMSLLKREVGELALHVLTHGRSVATSISELSSAPMDRYIGPEESRVGIRKRQSSPSKSTTRDVLEAVRGGRLT